MKIPYKCPRCKNDGRYTGELDRPHFTCSKCKKSIKIDNDFKLKGEIYQLLKYNTKEISKSDKNLTRCVYLIYLPVYATRIEFAHVCDTPKDYLMYYEGVNLFKDEVYSEPKLSFMTRCTWFEANNDVTIKLDPSIQKNMLKWYKSNLYIDTINYIEQSIKRGYFSIEYYAKRKDPKSLEEFLDKIVIDEHRYFVEYKSLREYVDYLKTETNWGTNLDLFQSISNCTTRPEM